MNSIPARLLPGCLAATLYLLACPGSLAHDAANMNDTGVERMNDSIAAKMLEVQVLLSEYFQRRRKPATWPDQDLVRLESDLEHMKEDADMSLEYFLARGVNVQSPEVLKEYPIAGRAVAASQAVNTAIALARHVVGLESQEALVKEVYSQGLTAYMYNLVGAYREKMDLYGELLKRKSGDSDVPQQDGET